MLTWGAAQRIGKIFKWFLKSYVATAQTLYDKEIISAKTDNKIVFQIFTFCCVGRKQAYAMNLFLLFLILQFTNNNSQNALCFVDTNYQIK